MRVGFGYDVHKLTDERKLILGGVDIPSEMGLLGHSDADVLLHAVMDALLGASALGDIGKLFPDTDERFKGANSLDLLGEVLRVLRDNGFSVNNIDATIAVQKPKIAPYIDLMRENIAKTLKIDKERVGVKATTTEKLGFEGRGEGVSAYAICSVFEKEELKK